ncbi:MAG: hypothetical protein NZ891_05375, partial [bacterium]|nr:hypothetical protein [bacterium]MDW8164153.1 hypothetical protein [Candidatus Omnitrophota bacterium]
MKKKIMIIGSSQYRNKIEKHAETLKKQGHSVKIPAFDDKKGLDALGVCEYNKRCIKWAEEV